MKKTQNAAPAVNSSAAPSAEPEMPSSLNLNQAYEHIPTFLSKPEADELYDTVLRQRPHWTMTQDGSAKLNYGVSYDRGGPVLTEIPEIPDFLRSLADRVSQKTQHPVNYVQVHIFTPEHDVRPHADPPMCVPMLTVGQERVFRVGGTMPGGYWGIRQKNRKVEKHVPEKEILMRHGDLLVFYGAKVLHSMFPASRDEAFNPNGREYRISLLFRWTTEAMRTYGVGVCNKHGHREQYSEAVAAFRARQREERSGAE